MSRDGSITLPWADADYVFCLRWGELSQLQEKCDAGPYVVLQRLQHHLWRVEDISNVIRLGLIGGDMKPADALKLVRAYVEARPPLENVTVAVAILSAALAGAPEEGMGEDAAPDLTENSSTISPTES